MKDVLNLIPLTPGHKTAHNFKNLEGQRFYRLKIGPLIGHVPYNKAKKRTVYLALCDCGNKIQVRGNDLVCNSVRSCGCFKKEQITVLNKKNKTKAMWCTFSAVWQSYKQGAKTRDLEFSISKEYFYELTQRNCNYCGVEPSQKRKPREANKLSSFIYNGIDRLDSGRGYVKDNCVPCCGACNKMKSNLALGDWLDHMRKIINNVLV